MRCVPHRMAIWCARSLTGCCGSDRCRSHRAHRRRPQRAQRRRTARGTRIPGLRQRGRRVLDRVSQEPAATWAVRGQARDLRRPRRPAQGRQHDDVWRVRATLPRALREKFAGQSPSRTRRDGRSPVPHRLRADHPAAPSPARLPPASPTSCEWRETKVSHFPTDQQHRTAHHHAKGRHRARIPQVPRHAIRPYGR